MPGLNGSGPQGDGPMTGRGMGRCRNNNSNNITPDGFQPGGPGMGRGPAGRGSRGRGLGTGRGSSTGKGAGFRHRSGRGN